jgi:hypothetical protein
MKHLLLVTAPALVVSACSVSGEISIGTPSMENATEDVIEGTLTEQMALGDLTANCSKPSSEDVGSRFLCTADTEDGRTIEFQAVIEEDGPFVETTNVVLAENLAPIVATVLAEIENLAGVDLTDDALDCGAGTLVVDASNQIVCDLTDPVGDVFDTIITFNGLDTDSPTFDFEVLTDS